MDEIYGGHLVAKYLKEVEGVETVFSLCGAHIDRIYDGFLEYGVRLIDVRHEQAAAMMAHAWSIFSGKPGVCLVTAGPGFTNTLTGLVNAYQENAPIVVLSGTAPVRDWGQGALQEMKQADMIKSTVKWFDLCLNVKRIPEYLSTAFRQAVSGRPGPVFLELPPDVLNVKVREDQIVKSRKGGVVFRTPANPSRLSEAADLINKAEKPLLLGGSGVALSECDGALKEFIQKTGMPHFLMNTGRGAIPDTDPLSLWDGGFMALLTVQSQADLIVAMGIRFNWLLSYGKIFPNARIVRIDIDPTEIDRNRSADVGLVGDLNLVLDQLNKLVVPRDHSAWRETLKKLYAPVIQKEIEAQRKPSFPIHPARLVHQVQEAIGKDALYIIDGGDTSYFGLTVLKARERSSVVSAAGGQFGCLGTGIPFGIGAKAARPDKTVVVINGDGSFGLNAMEFCTAERHDLPFICVINNDCSWGLIRHGQEICYGKERTIGSKLGVVHYEKMAEALGGYGEFVEKDEEIIPAVERALSSGKPACINVLTDPCVSSPVALLFVQALKME